MAAKVKLVRRFCTGYLHNHKAISFPIKRSVNCFDKNRARIVEDKQKILSLKNYVKKCKGEIPWSNVVSKTLELKNYDPYPVEEANVGFILVKLFENEPDIMTSLLEFITDNQYACLSVINYVGCYVLETLPPDSGSKIAMKMYDYIRKHHSSEIGVLGKQYLKYLLRFNQNWNTVPTLNNILEHKKSSMDYGLLLEQYIKAEKNEKLSDILKQLPLLTTCVCKTLVNSVMRMEGSSQSITFKNILDILNAHKIKLVLELNVCKNFYKLIEFLNAMGHKFKWTIKLVGIGPNLICPCCNNKLDEIVITVSEQEALLKIFECFHVKKMPFLKTNQEEWNYFLDFINKHEYNLVLDGLNLLKKIDCLPSLIRSYEKILLSKAKPMVIARKHVKDHMVHNLFQWSSEKQSKVPMFLVDDCSHDDLFVLYAAMKKPGCRLVSGDFFRNFKYLEPVKYQNIYNRWFTSSFIFHQNSIVPSIPIENLVQCITVSKSEKHVYHVPLKKKISDSTAPVLCITASARS